MPGETYLWLFQAMLPVLLWLFQACVWLFQAMLPVLLWLFQACVWLFQAMLPRSAVAFPSHVASLYSGFCVKAFPSHAVSALAFPSLPEQDHL